MNNFPRFVSRHLGKAIPAGVLLKRPAPVFLPFYHVVSNEKLPHILNYPYRNIEQFEKELEYFLTYFHPVSLEEILQGKKQTKRVFHLSFDDGLKECAEVIAPILKRKGIPATFFVNTGFVDNLQLFHKYKTNLILNALKTNPNPKVNELLKRHDLAGKDILNAEINQVAVLDEVAKILELSFQEFLAKQEPYLTTQQILQLHDDGFSIGAHSHDHPEFYKISEEEQLGQVEKSMAWIVEKLQPKIKTFSFPFTDDKVPATVLKRLFDENLCDITFGTAGVKFDESDFHFQRYPVEQTGNFRTNLKGEFFYFELRKLIGKATVKH
ncbi:MAG TPA: polysaccharide deacetylase family protein [Prolixibacteraceae bacterium]|nr:polysaccharide deacetylase family protein [Prolixibacteraceae bacterium]